MKIRPSVAIIRGQKILLLRYSYSGKDVYQLPGGNMDEGETMEQTVARELREELGLLVNVKSPLLVAQVFQEGKKMGVLHTIFSGEIAEDAEPIINTKETSALEVLWIGIELLPTLNLYPAVGQWLSAPASSSDIAYIPYLAQPWW